MRYRDIQNWLMRQEAVRQGTVRIEFDQNGRPIFRPIVALEGESLPTFRQAADFVEDLGLTGAEVYDDGADFGMSVFNRNIRSQMLKDPRFEGKRVRVQQQVYKFESAAQAERLAESTIKDGKALGLLSSDANKARLTRIFVDDQELTQSQILDDVFRDVLNIHADPTLMSSKTDKRIKAFTTSKRAEAMFDDPLRVSIIDGRSKVRVPKGMDHTAHAQKAIDGALEVSTFHLQKQREFLETRIDELNGQLDGRDGPRITDRITRMKAEAELKKEMGALKEINGAIRGTSKTFNVRLLNFDLLLDEGMEGLSEDDMNTFINRIQHGASAKGNATVSSELDAEMMRRGWDPTKRASQQTREFLEQAIDFRTHFENIKGDRAGSLLNVDDARTQIVNQARVRQISNRKRNLGFATLENQKIGDLYADFQSVTAHTEIYDRRLIERMMDETVREFEGMARQLDEAGEVPFMVRQMIERQAGVLEGMQRWQIDELDPVMREEALDVLARLDENASISDNPFLKRRVLGILKEGASRKGLMRLKVPDAFRAYVGTTVSDNFTKQFDVFDEGKGRMVSRTLQDGEVTLDPTTNRLIMTDADFIRYYPNFGGPDLDDALNSMIRVAPDGKMRMVLTRSPTARGELAFMDVLDDGTMFKQALIGRMAGEERYRNLSNLTKPEDVLSRLLSENQEFQNFLSHQGTDEMIRATGTGDFRELKRLIGARSRQAEAFGIDGQFLLQQYNLAKQRTNKSAAFWARQEIDTDPRMRAYRKLTTELQQAQVAGDVRRIAQLQEGLNKFLTGGGRRQMGMGTIDDAMEAAAPSRRGGEVILGQEGSIEYYRYEGERGGLIYQRPTDAAKKAAAAQHISDSGLSEADARLAAGRSIGREAENRTLLGQFSNARMLWDNYMGMHEDALVRADIIDNAVTSANYQQLRNSGKIIATMEQEVAIDSIKGMADGFSPDQIRGMIQDTQRRVIQHAMEAVKMDPSLQMDEGLVRQMGYTVDAKSRDPGRIGRTLVERLIEDIQTDAPELRGVNYDQLFSSEGLISQGRQRLDELHATFDEMMEASRIDLSGAEIKDMTRARRDARNIKAMYRQSLRGLDDIIDPDMFAGLDIDTAELSAIKGQVIGDDILRAVAETFDTARVGPDDRIERVASRRTYEALAMLDEDILSRLPSFGLVENLARFARGDETQDVTLASINRMRGQTLLPGLEVERVIEDVLGEDAFHHMRRIDHALSTVEESDRQISEGTRRLLADIDEGEYVTRMSFGDSVMRSFLDPDAVISDSGMQSSIGELIQDAIAEASDPTDRDAVRVMRRRRKHARRTLRRASETYFDVAAQMAEDSDLPEDLRGILGESIPGARKARYAQEATEASGNLVENVQKTGFLNMAQDLLETRAGRYGAVGLTAVLAASIFHSRKDRGDRTLEEMQGPSHLPGGNPYTRARGLPSFAMPEYTPQESYGVTYEMRGNGGDSQTLIDSVNSLTGSNVTTTTYSRGGQSSMDDIMSGY